LVFFSYGLFSFVKGDQNRTILKTIIIPAPLKKDSVATWEKIEEKEKLSEKLSDFLHQIQKELKSRLVNFTAKSGYLEIMNKIANRKNLPILTEKNLDSLKQAKYLQPLKGYLKKDHLEPKVAFLDQPTKDFLEKLPLDFFQKFGKPLTVTSAARTVEQQIKLVKKNKNAAKGNSMHVRGCAVDISYKSLSGKEIRWLEDKFSSLLDSNVWVTKERLGSQNFHVVVFE